VVVVAVVGIAAVLLALTVQNAQSINDKAQNIATTGRGINLATDSVVQLNRTNRLARSILKSARPLETQLGGIVGTAQGIDGLAASINSNAQSINGTAGSINGTAGSINDSAGTINTSAGSINAAAGTINSTAGSINSSAGRINSTAGSINSSAGSINRSAGRINSSAGTINSSARRIDTIAGSILGTARLVDRDVTLINTNLNVTLSLVTAVKGDTAGILAQAGAANETAACISFKLFGPNDNYTECPQTAAARAQASVSRAEAIRALKKEKALQENPEELEEPEQTEGSDPDAAPQAAPGTAPAPVPAPAAPEQGAPNTPPLPALTPEQLKQLEEVIEGLGLDPSSLTLEQQLKRLEELTKGLLPPGLDLGPGLGQGPLGLQQLQQELVPGLLSQP